MDLETLITGLGIGGAGRARGVRVCDITDDSRTVVPGTLFIARRGTKTDGRRFIPAAVDAGAAAVLTDDPAVTAQVPVLVAPEVEQAAAVLAERFFGSPTTRLALVGITGTNGKTTTAHLVHQVLNSSGVRCGLIGTILIDDGREVARATLTTPPAAELSRTFATMVEHGRRAAAMEVSSHALHQRRVAGLSFRVGVFTNLTGDHLDYHGTMEAYAEAKAGLFRMLPEGGTAVLNAEDDAAPLMAGATRARVWRCAIDADADCTAAIRRMSSHGSAVAFRGPWGAFDAELRLLGRHNVMNALQAAAACHALGLAAPDLKRSLEAAAAPPGRLEPVTSPRDLFAVLVDYAHTDDALRKVLTALRPMLGPGGALRVVFGCGGDRDRTKRPRMGAAAADLADMVYVTSDNPRTEQPGAIIDEIVGGIPRGSRAHVEPDRAAAIARAIADAAPGDIVLIAGKGHETEQLLPDGRGGVRTTQFDDREAAREALASREGVRVPPARRVVPA